MAVSRKSTLDYLMQDLQSRGMAITEGVINLSPEDLPQSLRHSCKFTGITFLEKNIYSVPVDEFSTANLTYYYCQACGKLYASTQLEGVGGF